MKHFLRYVLVIVAVVTVSCDSDDPKVADIGKDYFPLRKGVFQIYDVEEIRYQLNTPETFEYELKTSVVDSLLNSSGDYTYVIYRYKRDKGAVEWQYLDTWSGTINNREAIQSEGNIAFVKFKLPVQVGTRWNGNTYNAGVEDEYILEEKGESNSFNGIPFDDCISITQSDNDDFIVYLDQRKEIYAKGVGLVYKETTQLNYCTDTALGCIGQQIIESGVIYKQTILGYGVE